MVTVKDVDPQELISLTKEELKKMKGISPPEWADWVKTGMSRERPPDQDDWWYIRSAAVLRKIYLNGPIGIQRLRKEFGGRKNRGHKPEHFYPGSGSIIRKILQQLETEGFIKKIGKRGRFITPKGQKFLDELSYKLVEKK
ncbi:MAG: 30S ribosomal protein S19e [Candidatus Aenigmarchaeota archaeon]|nr:30S ribosomal protein S19e [Candidatus Aenigmarchaeota archaeon]